MACDSIVSTLGVFFPFDTLLRQHREEHATSRPQGGTGLSHPNGLPWYAQLSEECPQPVPRISRPPLVKAHRAPPKRTPSHQVSLILIFQLKIPLPSSQFCPLHMDTRVLLSFQ